MDGPGLRKGVGYARNVENNAFHQLGREIRLFNRQIAAAFDQHIDLMGFN